MFLYKISPRAKRIRITINQEGQCIVTLPKRGSREHVLKEAEEFIKKKSSWIQKHIDRIQKQIQKKKEDGTYIDNARKPVKRLSKGEHESLKMKTKDLVMARLAHFNTMYSYIYHDVRIKKLSSRWGSCSRRGNLNFSHKLALVSPEELDYVVVHELCHLGEFNHSPAFWNLVERAIPNYREIRKQLKGRVI